MVVQWVIKRLKMAGIETTMRQSMTWLNPYQENIEEHDGLRKRRKRTLEADGLEILCVVPCTQAMNTDEEDNVIFVKEEQSNFISKFPQQIYFMKVVWKDIPTSCWVHHTKIFSYPLEWKTTTIQQRGVLKKHSCMTMTQPFLYFGVG
ncbi:uncharacterized protein LOC114540205 [Dendronephthya gigantea]|uniref:uncharacterized protein LOC114540205 n=1 Tax=Dendronephthya gigantea TaxID=151771 RepID=UPI00106BA81E|nr:uncharacterized protein LOC114540205 [Dendronephthya gigantea]